MSTLYEVSSLITLVMNKPNMFAQVLGVLNKDTQIDVISISGAWAYFKYNNVNAYVKKGNLKILDSELIQVKGSITLKYLDSSTNNEIYSSETINNLELGSYSYEAKIIYGYKLQNDSTQSVNLTTESPNQVITFYYNQVLGSIIIKYVDITTNTDIYESKTIENLSLGTYTYGSINISAYMLSDDKTKTVTITESSPSETITFKYTKILGTVTVKYIDNSSSTELLPADTFTDLKLGNYSYNSKDISGYTITNDSTQTIELTDDNYNIEIEFKYNKLFGSVTIKYLDSSSLKEIDTPTIISNLPLGTYSYTAKSLEEYDVIGDSNQSVTLNDTNLNPIISFNYSRKSGNITIEYLDSSTLAVIHPSTKISNIALGSYTYDAIYIDNYEVDGDSSISTTLTTTDPNQTISFKYNEIEIPEDLNWNEVPYISTYYIKPVVKPGEEVFIDYYITDYYYKEYLEEDYSETFTITVRVEGQDDKLYHYLKAGDHKVSLGSFNNEGEQKFSILCTDKYGRNSHELFNFFLVQDDIEIREYVMTEEDLITYNIKNTDDYEEKVYVKVDKLTDTTVGTKIEEIANTTTVPSNKYICFIGTTEEDEDGNPIMQTTPARFWLNTIVKYADDYDKESVLEEATQTRIGLQNLLDDKKALGYNKLLLLPGNYRIDHQETIYIPDKFTLNMNGATLKANQFTGDKSLILSLDDTFDSHVINGNIEGDYFSHDYSNSPNNSEWCMGVSISGSSKYSSFENIIIKDITGYGAGNGISGKSGYVYFGKSLGNIFSLGDISTKDGSIISSTDRQSTSFIDISQYVKYDYVTINRYLGYQGILGSSWNLILHFYDSNKNYIKSINAFQYRRTLMPINSAFMKITILGSISSIDFWMTYFKIPCHCNFTNIEFNNCRCVGLAQGAMNDMLVDNCKFTLNGQSGAYCAYDAEDGWDQMQDVTFKNLDFYDNYRNDFLTCSGHNFIIDSQLSGKIYIWERTRSLVIKNSSNVVVTLQSGGKSTIVRHGVYRIYNNDFSSGALSNNLSRNNSCKGLLSGVIYDSVISDCGDNSFYNNCIINISKPSSSKLTNITMINCTLKPVQEFTDRYTVLFIGDHEGSYYFKNCSFLGRCSLGDNGDFYSGHFVECNFENINIFPNVKSDSNDLILFENCTLNCFENNFIYYRPFAYTQGTYTKLEFNNCIINVSKTTSSFVYAYAKPNGYCKFIDSVINIMTTLTIFDGTFNYIDYITNYNLIFINSPLPSNINLISSSYENNSNIKITIQ